MFLVIAGVVVTLFKAVMTGIGLATGFAFVGGIPGAMYRLTEAKLDGTSQWRALVPPWMFSIFGVVHTEQEQQDPNEGRTEMNPAQAGSPN